MTIPLFIWKQNLLQKSQTILFYWSIISRRIQHLIKPDVPLHLQVIDVTEKKHYFSLSHNKGPVSAICSGCNHSRSDDLIPLNTALFEVPRGSTEEMVWTGGWRHSFPEERHNKRHGWSPPFTFSSSSFFFKRKCAHIWVAVMAALYFLCTWFNWLVLHLGVEFSLSLTVELVLCSNWSGQRRLGLKHFKSRCHSEKIWNMSCQWIVWICSAINLNSHSRVFMSINSSTMNLKKKKNPIKYNEAP